MILLHYMIPKLGCEHHWDPKGHGQKKIVLVIPKKQLLCIEKPSFRW